MNRIVTFILCILFSFRLYAIPAKPGVTRIVTKADGTSFCLHLCGDETFHYYVDDSGQPYRRSIDGTWMPDFRDVKAIRSSAAARRNASRVHLAQHMRRAMKAPAHIGELPAGMATKKGLLILVNFKDKQMVHGDDSKRIFDQMLNGLNDSYGENYGSVREYFRDQSYGQFDITFDVVGPVTVSQNMSHYGANDSNNGDQDVNPEAMIVEAIQLADSDVNFADYDWDGDGEVENIYVTYAGYGEAQGAEDDTIWPHAWSLRESGLGAQIVDGVKVSTYACGSELNGNSGTKIDGIGTMCHEYSHCLGLPDFYDTDYSGGHGMFSWDLMDSGSYNNDGYCPAGYTAYEREFCGWLIYKELQPNTRVNDMPNIEDNAEAYVIYNEANRNEYYLLANHQRKGWNKFQAAHGMLVIHVDYNKTVWNDNKPNDDPSRQRMTIVPADDTFDYLTLSSGKKHYYANSGDTYPGSSGNTELTDISKPAAKLYNANVDGRKYLHKPITDISETDGLISFSFMKESVVLEVPVFDEEKTTQYGAFIHLVWNQVEEAVSYDISYTMNEASSEGQENEENEGNEIDDAVLDALTFWESFDHFFAEEDGSADLGNNLNLYTEETGWIGEKVFKGIYGAKLGSGSKGGYLTTPTYTSSSGTLTLYLLAFKWMSLNGKIDDSELVVSLLDSSGKEVSSQTITPKDIDDVTYQLLTFSDVPSSYKIKMATTEGAKRVYLSGILAFDGSFTEEQIAPILETSSVEEPDEVPDPQTVILRGITTNDYWLTDLPLNTTVTVSVRAVGDEDNLSAWSEPYTFETGDMAVRMNRLAEQSHRTQGLFDLSGRRVGTAPLRRGIYLSGGRKVLIL